VWLNPPATASLAYMSALIENTAMRRRGVILQANYRIQSGRPVVHLYGRLEDGRSFLVRDRRQRPHFYLREHDAAHAGSDLRVTLVPSTKRTFDGVPVVRAEVALPSDVPDVRDRMHDKGVETFEADVRFAMRYLIDRGIKGGCEIVGEAHAEGAIDCVFDDAELQPAAVEVVPRVLAFDIETDLRANELLAISLFAPGVDEVYIVDAAGRAMPEHAIACRDARTALDAFCDRVRVLDPDVITGWNIVDFDLTVLQRIARRIGHPLELGRDGGALRLRPPTGYFGSGSATIPGRLVLDGIDLLRGAFIRVDDHSLDAVARSVLGEGKAVSGAVDDRGAEIQHNYAHDLVQFAAYARTDARLAYRIVESLRLVSLAFARSQLTGMTPDRVAASIASFDFLYLTELERRGLVAPSVRSDDARVHAAQHGGEVLEPEPGLHANVWVFDFTSLYPSIIRTFNIDPLTYVQEGGAVDTADLIVTPDGIAFTRVPGILPAMLDELFPRRIAAKRAGDAVASQAIKILMNSFYGVLGTPACRFHNAALANAITGLGRFLLHWSKDWFERAGYQVLYGDTDSVFVAAGTDDHDAALTRGPELAQALTRDLDAYIADRWRLANRCQLNCEKLYETLFLPRMRGSDAGARKRYVGRIAGADIEFVGMEVVRRDWTPLAKQVQRELYQRLFARDALDVYLADIVRAVRAGSCDDLLVYRKGLRKPVADYTASTPPHVAAARKSRTPPGRVIAYVMTTAGAEPIDNVQHPIDREHYVNKQIRPIAQPVLDTLGLTFDRVVGDDRQLELF
jgi:DNA polymerase II